ncbi:MAG: AMP-binding protein, partial [Woeseia sp.]
MYRFMASHGFNNYEQLHAWSIERPGRFWQDLADFCDLRFDSPASEVLLQPGDMTTANWFPGSELNFASHLLRYSGDQPAIIFCGEDGTRRELSWFELKHEVGRTAAALLGAGVCKGDRVAAFLPNCPEAIVAMLATASIGAVWSSCSPDFGINGVVDRFGQIEPKVLFCADGYFYNGKRFDSQQAVTGVVEAIGSIRHTVVVPFTRSGVKSPSFVWWDDFLEEHPELSFTPLPFDHPLYIMYSSGTTGVPKCIVHGAGGTLIQHLKEHVLHGDIRRGDRLFYFTTCGWMMWN